MLPWDKEVFGCTKDRIEACTKALSSIQMMQIDDPMSSGLLQAEVNYRRQLAELCWQEESCLRQQSRIHWLWEGDANTAFFHASVRA